MFVAGVGAAAAVAMFLMMANESSGAIVLFLLALLMLVAGALALRKVHANKIAEEYTLVGGCKEPFLASLE